MPQINQNANAGRAQSRAATSFACGAGALRRGLLAALALPPLPPPTKCRTADSCANPKQPLFVIRTSSFLRPSPFVIRHYPLILIVLLCLVAPARAATNDLFAQGVESSRAGQFPEAAAAFAQAAKARPAAGTLVNLGLAEWQRGHGGAAILAWERAQWLDPYDARAAADLQFARQVAQVDAPPLKWFEAVSTWLPPNAWVWLAGATLWLTVGLMVLPGIFRWRKAGWHQWLAALACGGFLFSLTANVGVVSRTRIGFVLNRNTPLRLTPTQGGETITTLAAGEPVRLVRTRGKYALIRTLNTAGWLEPGDFQLVYSRPDR